MRKLIFMYLMLALLVPKIVCAHNSQSVTTPTVVFFQVYTFAAYDGLLDSKFPGIEDEPTVIIIHEVFDNASNISNWIKGLYNFSAVDVLDINTVVEVYYNNLSDASPTFFKVGYGSEFTIWWFGGANTLLPDFITMSMAADYEGDDFFPQLQVTFTAEDFILLGKKCLYPTDDEELTSFDEFSLQQDQIFFAAVKPFVVQVEKENYKQTVEQYMNLRGQQRARAGTIPLTEDRGYQVIEDLFKYGYSLDDFEYAKNKRLPISSKTTVQIHTEYDVPPRLLRGPEVITKALDRVLDEEEIIGLKGTRINLLINEKGRIEEMNVESSIRQNLKQKLLKALKLMKWEPAQLEGKPIKVWTILVIP